MPRVDAYLGDRVPTAPRRPTRFQEQPQTGGLAVAQGLDRVAQATAQIYEDQKQKANETFAISTQTGLNALSQAHAYSSDRGPDGKGVKGILTMQGRLPGEAYTKNLEEVDAQLDMLKSTAKTTEQQVIFAKMATAWRANYVEAAQKHTYIETEKYNAGERQALKQSTVNTGAAAFGTPDQDKAVEEQLRIGAAVIDDQAKAQGLAPEDASVKLEKARHRSKMLAMGLHKLIDADKDVLAKAEWDKRMTATEAFPAGQILEEDAAALRPKLAAASTDGAAFRAARAIAATTPRNADGSMRMADMEAEAARQAGDNTKQYERTMQYLRSQKIADDDQRQQVTNANKWSLYLALEQGASITAVQQMPQWKDAGTEYQGWLLNTAQAKARADANYTRSLLSQKREDHRWYRSLLDEPLQDYARAQTKLEIENAGLFEDIMSNPEGLVTKDESWLVEVAPKLSDRHFREVRKLLKTVQGDMGKAAAAKVDDNTLKASAADAGMSYAFSTTQTPTQRQNMADLRVEVSAEVARTQQAGVAKTGMLTPLSQEDYRAAADRVTKQRMYKNTIFGPSELTRAQVSRDDVGNVSVRMPDMPPELRDYFINEIRTMPTRDGTRLSELGPEVIVQRYGAAIERAAAAALLRAGEAAWRPILRDAVAGYVEPARGTTGGASGSGPSMSDRYRRQQRTHVPPAPPAPPAPRAPVPRRPTGPPPASMRDRYRNSQRMPPLPDDAKE